MRTCDLCGNAIIARVVFLGDRADRRVWLCAGCHARHEDHELAPADLLALARLTASRTGKCDWCGGRLPAVQVRVPGAESRLFAFHLCAECAREAREEAGARVLHPEAALEGDSAVEARYEHAREVARRRRAIHRVK